jgi:hypothetical protein
MINTTIKITHESATQRASNEAWLHLHGVQECALRESKVYRGKIADVQQRATRARLRRSTVCPAVWGKKGGRGGEKKRKRKKQKSVLTRANKDARRTMRLAKTRLTAHSLTK